ncbi:MAG: hypothetical protein ACOVOQ_11450 [Flavobacterium sp.]
MPTLKDIHICNSHQPTQNQKLQKSMSLPTLIDDPIKNTERTTAVCRNGGFSAFLETFVLVESLGIFSNFGAEKPPLLQAAKRCTR